MSAVRVVSLLGATGSIGDSTLDVIARHPDRYAVACAGRAPAVGEARGPVRAVPPRRWPRCSTSTRRARSSARSPAAACPPACSRARTGSASRRRCPRPTRCWRRSSARRDSRRRWPRRARASGSCSPTRKRWSSAAPCSWRRWRRAAPRCCRSTASTTRSSSACRRATTAGRTPPACGASCSPRRAGRSAAAIPRNSRGVTPAEACAHPNWSMGRKISVDSATMMNKGLEVIEAHWLFGVPPDRIEVVIHPQSVIHSLVEYVDGSVLAQLGHPDMRTPIAQALAYPARIDAGVPPLDLIARAGLDFSAPDAARFPCLRPRLRGARRGRHRAGGAERGQRSRGRRVSRRQRALHRHRLRLRRRAGAHPRACRCARSTTRWRPMRGRACRRARLPPPARRRLTRPPDGSRHQGSVVPVRARGAGRHPRARPLPRRPLVRRQDRPVLGRLRPGRLVAPARAATGPSGRCRRCRWAATSRWPTSARATSRPADLARAFNRQSVWKRVAIVAAGPVANLLLAVALFAGTFVAGVPGQKALLAQPPAGSAGGGAPASRAGDLVVAVDGVPVSSWQDLRWRLLKASGRDDAAVEVARAGRSGGDPACCRCRGLAATDWEGPLHAGAGTQARFGPPLIDQVVAGKPAARAGLLAGRPHRRRSTTRRSGRRPTSRRKTNGAPGPRTRVPGRARRRDARGAAGDRDRRARRAAPGYRRRAAQGRSGIAAGTRGHRPLRCHRRDRAGRAQDLGAVGLHA